MFMTDYYEFESSSLGPVVATHIAPTIIYQDALFLEGPAYFAAGRYLVVSDIPNDRLLRYDETNGAVSVFRSSCGYPNGNTVDREGRLVTCEHLGRRVSRTEVDGSITTVAEHWRGKKLNSPNDVVVKSDGSIWFTDPDYGIRSDLEGALQDGEIGACNVYRVDPQTGGIDAVITDMIMPNGLAFSNDESVLYVSESGRTRGPEQPTHIRAFNVRQDNTVTGGRVLVPEPPVGHFDGFRIDRSDRIWAATSDGVRCYEAGGAYLGRIKLPTAAANLTFAGARKNNLFVCASTSLYLVRLHRQ